MDVRMSDDSPSCFRCGKKDKVRLMVLPILNRRGPVWFCDRCECPVGLTREEKDLYPMGDKPKLSPTGNKKRGRS